MFTAALLIKLMKIKSIKQRKIEDDPVVASKRAILISILYHVIEYFIKREFRRNLGVYKRLYVLMIDKSGDSGINWLSTISSLKIIK